MERIKSFYRQLEEIYRLNCVKALLDWDQQVCMPPAAGSERAKSQEFISRLVHERFTAPEFIRLVDDLWDRVDGLDEPDRVNVREIKRLLDRERKLPPEFVAEKAKASSLSYLEWTKARPKGDFARVEPHLEKLTELNRREAEMVGWEENPYDVLLDSFEPHARFSKIKPLLLELASKLSPMVAPLAERFKAPEKPPAEYPAGTQERLCVKIASDMGYDFKRGRLDKTHHPFQISLGADDIRVTTRFDEQNYLFAVFTTLHEGGHALYEMGLERRWRGTPMGSPVSLAIHESQSRLWENLVGRSMSFCIYLHRVLKDFFPEEHKQSSPESIWSEVNHIAPSLIRIEADEVTYSLHVVIRMLLEEELVNARLKVAELPEAWNGLYLQYLGIKPAGNREGVLQDVHWYSGMLGYFPTYVLGNFYSAQFMEAARREINDLEGQIAGGSFKDLRRWLQDRIHSQGMRYPASELALKVAGRELSPEPFVSYLKRKFAF